MFNVQNCSNEKIIKFVDVIHTVGPQEENPDALRSCYETSLQLLIDNDLRSIVGSIEFFLNT